MAASYMEAAIAGLESVTSLKGKTILEIGGTPAFKVPRLMAERGAKRIVVSNIGHGIREAEENGLREGCIEARYADGLKLDDYFEPNSFDIAFATAVLEHIPDTARLMASIDSVLKPGGHVFLSGSPVWSGPKGHHLWVNTSKGPARFSRDDCPVPDWAHLALDADEMTAYLQENTDYDAADIEAIVHWIYRSPRINRLTADQIREAIEQSGYEMLKLHAGRRMKANEFYERAQERNPGVDLQVAGMRFLLRKPTASGGLRRWVARLLPWAA